MDLINVLAVLSATRGERRKEDNKKQEETKKVKEILKLLPYRIKIKHGTGTGSGWIKAYIPKSVWALEKENVELLIATATMRPQMGENYILVHWYE